MRAPGWDRIGGQQPAESRILRETLSPKPTMFFWRKGSSDLTLFVSLADCTLPDSMEKLKGCVASHLANPLERLQFQGPMISPCHCQCKMSLFTPSQRVSGNKDIILCHLKNQQVYLNGVYFQLSTTFLQILVSMICHPSIPSTEALAQNPKAAWRQRRRV